MGPLGFLAHDALLAEERAVNLGLLDQARALAWIARSIAAFGGDPSRVTLFGNSAGALSSALHVYLPQSAGLFTRAALMSAAPWRLNTIDEARAVGSRFAQRAGCVQGDARAVAACLRALSAANVSAAASAVVNPFYFVGDVRSNFAPAVDGVTVKDQPLALFNSHIPTNPVSELIVGSNHDEGDLLFGVSARLISLLGEC